MVRMAVAENPLAEVFVIGHDDPDLIDCLSHDFVVGNPTSVIVD